MEKETVSISDVEHIMKLSRLEFSESEKKSVRKNLNDVVDYFSILSQVDTSNVEAVNKEVGTLREDVIKPSMDSGDVVKNAPKHTQTAFIVPRVVE